MAGTLIGPSGRYELGSEIVTIGRARANKIVIEATQASGRHAEVRPEGNGYILLDLGSTNGTKLNGLKIPAQNPQPLRHGDVITVGGLEIRVELAAAGSAYAPTERAAFPPAPGAFPPAEQEAFPPPPAQGAYAPTQRAGAPPVQGAFPSSQPIEPPPPPPAPPGQFGAYGGVSPVGPASYYSDTPPPPPPPPPYTPPPPTFYGGAGGGATFQAPPSFPPPPPGGTISPFGLPPPPFLPTSVQSGPKRKPMALIAGIVIGVLLIGIIGILLITHGKGGTSGGSGSASTPTPLPPTATPLPGPQEIANEFYTDIELQNYMGAYQFLGPDFKMQESEQAFINTFTCSDRAAGAVTSFTAMLINSNTTQATVQVHVIRPGLTYDDPVQLTNGHGGWGVESYRFIAGCG